MIRTDRTWEFIVAAERQNVRPPVMMTSLGSRVDKLRFAIDLWSHPPGLNRRPADYESAALPAELGWPALMVPLALNGNQNVGS